MTTVLVTGCAGFIGSHLCDTLLGQGHTVIGIDNYLSGTVDNVNMLKKRYDSQFIFSEMNVCSLNSANMTTNLSCIYHLACPACVNKYQECPVDTMETCFNGTLAVLRLAYMIKDCKVIFTSTSEIYGDPEMPVQSEDYRGNVSTIGPRACYDEGKRAAEALITSYARSYDVDYTIARVFNTYGPRMIDDRVIPSFLRDAKNKGKISVHGGGCQTRSFCYVDDTVRALILMSGITYRGVINIGNPECITINQLADMIKQHTGCDVEHVDGREDDPTRRCPDIERANNVLNWQPNIPLKDGLNILLNLQH